MSWFLLTPANLKCAEWCVSILRGPVQIEAEDANHARYLAARYFCLESVIKRSRLDCPWTRVDLATCKAIDETHPKIPSVPLEAHNRFSPGQRLGRRPFKPATTGYLASPAYQLLVVKANEKAGCEEQR